MSSAEARTESLTTKLQSAGNRLLPGKRWSSANRADVTGRTVNVCLLGAP
jgi:hypothetical protein